MRLMFEDIATCKIKHFAFILDTFCLVLEPVVDLRNYGPLYIGAWN